MRIFEYEAKEIVQKYGLDIPKGKIICSPEEAATFATQLNNIVVLKPQVLSKKRGKAGAILFANNPQEAFEHAKTLFSMKVNQEKVTTILLEERIEYDQEYYIGMTIDYSSSKPIAIVSPFGGMDIEEIVHEDPSKVKKENFSISQGLSDQQLELLVAPFKKTEQELMKVILKKMNQIFREYDMELLEINPLVRDKHGKMVVLDAHMNIDDDSLFRHADLVKPRGMSQEEFAFEQLLREKRWKYIEMDPDGEIGILSSGAGITMAILDLIKMNGGRPSNFLDTAQMNADGIYDAFSLFNGNPKLKVLLVNIFAGLNRCDDLAIGIKRYLTEHQLSMPLVVRMIGYREDEGKKILNEINIEPIRSLEEAVEKVIQIAKGRE